jgi:cell division protein FtsW (lipid II flippase)
MDPARLRAIIGADLSLRHFAWLTLLASLALSVLGLYCIDVATNLLPPDPPLPVTPGGVVARQAIFLAVGLLAAAAVALPHYRFVRVVAWPAMWVTLALLVFLLIPAVPAWLVTPRNGARAWINLGPVDLQPSELAKIAFILVMADHLRYRSNHRTLAGLLPIGVLTFIPVALIMLQPDFGTAAIFIPTLFAMLLAAGARLRHLVAVVLIGAAAGPAAYPLLKPYQQQRILTLIAVARGDKDAAKDTAFQAFTAITLAGAGGLDGTTDPKARALVRYNRLPERHNDMVFSVIVARFGLVGALATLALFLAWFLGALLTAALCREPFGRLVVIGCLAAIAAQVFINVGMNVGLVPIVGITLPYVSYGGSSMLTCWIMTGLIVSVGTRGHPRLARPSFEFDE